MSSDLHHRIAEPLRALAVAVDDLHPDPSNARKHGPRNLDAIKGSLAAFGQRKPIVVQREGMIVRAGNGTLEAAKALGWEQIAAVVIDEDSAHAVQFAIADNRTAELAEWDDETLATLLDGMDEPTRDLLAF
jgi:ParB-like chromosome segregation protein Spo0J